LAQTEAYWGYGYGGLYGGLWGGMYGGLYSGMYGGLYGGYGSGYWGKRESTPPMEILNRTECIFSQEQKMLSCHGAAGIVECEAESTWSVPVDYQLFSLGLYKVAATPMKYRIMPRKLDNSGWESGMYMLNGEKKFASLYSVESTLETGLKVNDKICFQKMVDLLALSTRRELVQVDLEDVYVIGDLMVAKKMPLEEREEKTDVKKTKRSVEVVDELKEFKVRAEKEWDLVERNTDILVKEMNKLKRALGDLLDDRSYHEHSPKERRETDQVWRDSGVKRADWERETRFDEHSPKERRETNQMWRDSTVIN
jgi:hypothetical protein